MVASVSRVHNVNVGVFTPGTVVFVADCVMLHWMQQSVLFLGMLMVLLSQCVCSQYHRHVCWFSVCVRCWNIETIWDCLWLIDLIAVGFDSTKVF